LDIGLTNRYFLTFAVPLQDSQSNEDENAGAESKRGATIVRRFLAVFKHVPDLGNIARHFYKDHRCRDYQEADKGAQQKDNDKDDDTFNGADQAPQNIRC
jgi:hypothetical protein